MKIKSDSLYSRLGQELRDEFFPWYLSDNPSYDDMLAWCSQRAVSASNGSLWTLVNRHLPVWRLGKSIEAADEEAAALPPDADSRTRERVRALRFDLVMRDLTPNQTMAYLSHDLKERELEEKRRTARETAVDALLTEAGGDPAATALLKRFLEAVDARRAQANA